MDIELQVRVDPAASGLIQDAISFETGLTRKQAADPTLYAYEHHGAEFTLADPGALTCFYEDLILGRPMPTKFVARSVQLDTLFAIALFMHRDLLPYPSVLSLVASVDFVHRRSIQAFAHVPDDLAKFFRMLSAMIPKDLPKNIEGERVRTCVGWIEDYIRHDRFPHLGPHLPIAKRLDYGTNGFVVAQLAGDLVAGWVDLYREGNLRGVLVSPLEDGRRKVVASRKSVFVPFNLTRAAAQLNELEGALGETPGWKADELWLYSPELGTRISLEGMMEVFLRV